MAGWEEILAQGISDTANMIYSGATNYYWNNWAADREDRAVTRLAADMERAGLSKTLAAGGQAHTQAPVTSQSSPVNAGDAVMKSNILDLAKRDQDNKDRLAKAQETALNAEAELTRSRIPHTTTQTGLAEKELGSFDARLEAELKESAQRIENMAHQNTESTQRVTSMQEGVKASQQSRTESQTRVRLNEVNSRLAEQAITKGELAMRKISEEIQHDRRVNRDMDLSYKIKMLEAIRQSARDVSEMRAGNSHYSSVGRMATDLVNAFDAYASMGRSHAVTEYMDEYNKLLKSITGTR